MRYERLELDISTAACHELQAAVAEHMHCDFDQHVRNELVNLQNELRARLQRRDPDPKSPKNIYVEEWLDT